MLSTILTIIFIVILVKAAIIGSAYFWHYYYRSPTAQDETFYFRTEDGRRLAIHRYRAACAPSGNPVILCHGLGSNRYIFDLPGAPSLAKFLRQRGRDVWVAELRGSGMSDRPGLFRSDVPYSWGFEDHLRKDVPAIISLVLRISGATSVQWVGHSMGGLLALAYMASAEDSPIASAVTIGSPVDFSKIRGRNFRILLKLDWIVRYCPVFPPPFIAGFLTPVARYPAHHLIGLFQSRNINPETASRVLALAAQLITSSQLWLDFGRFLETGVFGPSPGTKYLEKMPTAPILTMGGTKDGLAPMESVMAASEIPSDSQDRELVILGRDYGCAEDYGHADLLVGKRVELEVFPRILHWLDSHDR